MGHQCLHALAGSTHRPAAARSAPNQWARTRFCAHICIATRPPVCLVGGERHRWCCKDLLLLTLSLMALLLGSIASSLLQEVPIVLGSIASPPRVLVSTRPHALGPLYPEIF